MADTIGTTNSSRPSRIPRLVTEACDWQGVDPRQDSDDIARRCDDDFEKPPTVQRAQNICDFQGDPPSPPPFDIEGACTPHAPTPQPAPSAPTAAAPSTDMESSTQPDIFSDAQETSQEATSAAPEPPLPTQDAKTEAPSDHLQVDKMPTPPSPVPQREDLGQAPQLCLDVLTTEASSGQDRSVIETIVVHAESTPCGPEPHPPGSSILEDIQRSPIIMTQIARGGSPALQFIPPIAEASVMPTLATASADDVLALEDKSKKSKDHHKHHKHQDREDKEARRKEKDLAERAKRELEKAERKERERAKKALELEKREEKEKQKAEKKAAQAKKAAEDRKAAAEKKTAEAKKAAEVKMAAQDKKEAERKRKALDKKNKSDKGQAALEPMPVGTEISAASDAQGEDTTEGAASGNTKNDESSAMLSSAAVGDAEISGDAEASGHKMKRGSLSLPSLGDLTSGLLKVLPGLSGPPKVTKETAERGDKASSQPHGHSHGHGHGQGEGHAGDHEMLEHMGELSHHLDQHLRERFGNANDCPLDSAHRDRKHK